MSPLLIEALKHLSVTCNTSGLHILDEDRIKVVFKALHKEGEILDPDLIKAWVTKNGWSKTPTKQISSWAEKIEEGGRVQLKNKNSAPKERQILELLKNRT